MCMLANESFNLVPGGGVISLLAAEWGKTGNNDERNANHLILLF